jgi:hypothetical protein
VCVHQSWFFFATSIEHLISNWLFGVKKSKLSLVDVLSAVARICIGVAGIKNPELHQKA